MSRHVLFALLAAGAFSVAQANTPADYAYAFPLDVTAPEHGGAWQVELTPAVYERVHDRSLRDIEIFDGSGRPVPMTRWSASTTSTSTEHSGILPALALPASVPARSGDLRLIIDRDADGRLRRVDAGEHANVEVPAQERDWLLDASAFDRPLVRIDLAWTSPASGVVARFAIASSNDLQQWRELGSATVLALEQDDARLERRVIAFDGVRAKYIRLQRLDDGPVLMGLSATAHSTEQIDGSSATAWLDLPAPSVAGSATGPSNSFEYRSPAALPVGSVRIRLADGDTVASLIVSGRSPGAEWREFARLGAFRLRAGNEVVENADITLSGPMRLGDLRIESTTPLRAPPRMALGYRPDRFVFLAEGDGPYLLAVGSVRARHADYPVDAALAGMRAKFGRDWQPRNAGLGSMRESAGASALIPPPAPTPWRQWVLWGVLAVGAATVAGFALTLLRGARGGDS